MHHPRYLLPNADLIVFGHTHSFTAVLHKGSLLINPGEICGRKYQDYTFALVGFEGGEFRVLKFARSLDNNFTEMTVEI